MNFPLLRRATLVFLALPLLIFLAGWLRLPLAVGASAIWLAAGWRLAARTLPSRDGNTLEAISWPWPWLAALVLPAAALTLLSGAGGWGAGDSDWLKHDTILRDLLTRSWPVTYESGQGPVLLVYYTAFYLPAALLGKITGGHWIVASQALALTMFCGIVLAGAWLVALGSGGARRTLPFRLAPGLVAAAVFGGFSGLDVLGKALINRWYGLPVDFGHWRDIEWWAQFAQYPGNAASLFWAPQHSFGAWLPLALALDDWFAERGPEGAWVFYGALALFWSPFAAVGLAPLLLGLLLWRWRAASSEGWPWWRRSFTLVNGAGALAGGIFAWYLLARFQPYPLPAFYVVQPGSLPMPLLAADHFPWPLLYLLFVGIEFVGLSVALWWFLAGRPEAPARQGKFLLGLATAILLALPFGRYGYANDLVMRGALPALFVLQILLVRMFARTGGPRRRAAVWLAALLLLGGLGNTALEYFRHLAGVVRQRSLRDARTHEPVRSLAELHREFYARPGFDFTRQYLGSADSAFAQHFAARRGPLAPGAPSPAPDF